MSVFSVLSLKGGVAKTTTAMHLAACAAGESRVVTVLDADEERSACRWASFVNGDMPFRVVPGERDRLAQQVRGLVEEGQVVIIDTPPNNREILSRAGMLANHAIVPVVPTGLDVDRMQPTLEMLRDVEATKGALDVAILFTRWRSNTVLGREALDALEQYPVLETRIRALERYAQAFGVPPQYLDEYSAVWTELNHG
jgi:chromosome partitioning protein